MHTDPDAPEIGRLQSLIRGLGAFLRARLRLLAYDLRQAADEALAAAAQAGAAVMAALVALQLALLLPIAAFWDTPWRLPVIGALLLLALIVAVACGSASLRRKRRATQLLSSVLASVDESVTKPTSLRESVP